MNYMVPITADGVDGLIAAVKESCEEWILNAINTSPKTVFLRDRGHFHREQRGVLMLRHYLRIIVPSHRIAFTHLILSNHCLAIEVLRWKTRSRDYVVPREWRLCRFCIAVHIHCVEDEAHAVLGCRSNESLRAARTDFWGLADVIQSGVRDQVQALDDVEGLRILLQHRAIAGAVGKLIFTVLKTFDTVEMYVPSRAMIEAVGDGV